MENKSVLTIAAVALRTGIAKEVLRKWESRYGFPVPDRDASGNRVYSAEQAERLQLIKRLLDEGLRPGAVVPMDSANLAALLAGTGAAVVDAPLPNSARPLIMWLQLRDPALLRERLRAELATHGLRSFILDLLPGMNELVGQAWARGDIAVRDEHLYTETVQTLVREALSHVSGPANSPRVLLTTPTGELHTLGILMVETLLTIEEAHCISLGAQSPMEEIVAAAADYRADIVGLSFSASFPKRKIAPALKELRNRLPRHIGLWAGGAGVGGIEHVPRGVLKLDSLNDVVQALEKYRFQAARKSG